MIWLFVFRNVAVVESWKTIIQWTFWKRMYLSNIVSYYNRVLKNKLHKHQKFFSTYFVRFIYNNNLVWNQIWFQIQTYVNIEQHICHVCIHKKTRKINNNNIVIFKVLFSNRVIENEKKFQKFKSLLQWFLLCFKKIKLLHTSFEFNIIEFLKWDKCHIA